MILRYAFPATPRELETDDVHVWETRLDVPPARSTLSADEQQRAERLVIPEKRQRFVAARAGLREILSLYTQTAADELVFAYSDDGKPALKGVPTVQFNLAHSEHLALVAVARQPIGIDLERLRPIASIEQMAQIAFSAEERAALAAFSGERQVLAFFRTWTRKESVMKARGGGFKLAGQFSVPVTDEARKMVVDGWTVEDLAVETGFVAALAQKL